MVYPDGTMYDSSNNLPIDTPENVVLDAEIAGFGTRCVAAMIDYFILIIILIVVTLLFANALRGGSAGSWGIAALALIQFCIVTFYHLFFEFLWNGQTPGKRWIGIRVIQSNGLPLTTSGAIIRNLLRLFDFLPVLYGVGLIALFATKNTQRLGDLAAKTIVVRERRQITLESVKENFTVQYKYITRITRLPYYVQIDKLDQNDRREVVSYLQRRKEMINQEYVVGIMAQKIANKMGVNGVADLHSPELAEMFLEQVARAFEVAQAVGNGAITANS
jgi:uncharacterized RDD family membrane protein YckC